LKNFITYHFINFLSRVLSFLPRILIIKLAKLFGILLYNFFPLRKEVSKQNIQIAFPGKSDRWINNIIKKTYQHYTFLIFEFMRQKFTNINSLEINIDDKTREILSSKNGFILMTAHLGNWELIVRILNLYKKSTIVVKEQRNLGGDRFVCEARSGNNIVLIKTKESKRKMVQAITSGHILGLASDQNADMKGTKIKFFGKETSVPKGAAFFHHKTRAPIAVGFCILNDNYSYDFSLRYISNTNINKNIENLFKDIGRKFSLKLESKIKEKPEQYFWFHRKWDRKIYKKH